MLWIWIALLAIFIIIEATTAQLLTIWFAVGAFVALLTSFATDNVAIQVGAFVIVSAVVLAITRPIVKKITKKSIQPTNADMYIGQEGIVTETVSNIDAKGLVKVKGSVWTARSADERKSIPEGARVKVLKIEGVKLIVEEIES